MKKPFLILRGGKYTALRSFACLLALTLLLACSVRLYRSRTEGQGSMEVFADETRPEQRPQGLYALLQQLLED